MSWSLSTTAETSADVADALQAAFDAQPMASDPAPGVVDQLEAAKEAAEALADSGAAGDGPWSISASGHARQGDTDASTVGVYLSEKLSG